MKAFIHDDFLLSSRTARRLYHGFAEAEPICDYHCHLPAQDIAENRQFENLYEIWLAGDHYKWRAMRADGVAERFCTGDAAPFEKFMAWARTVPHTLRNPLYHWTHLELKRYFGIGELLDAHTAQKVWDRANAKLATPELTAHGILKKFKVKLVGTTDDPTDDLKHHAALNSRAPAAVATKPALQDARRDVRQPQACAPSSLPTRVLPTFRPDKALALQQPAAWNAWVDKLAAAADVDIRSLDALLEALKRRHDFFGHMGARMSDHGLEQAPAEFCTDAEAKAIFRKARAGTALSPREHNQFAAFIMLFVGRLNAAKGWIMQLHLGAMRNNNTRLMKQVGPDTGFDSVGDFPQARALAAFLDRLDSENALPKVILYNLNPADNYMFAAMLGNFQDGSVPGKIQFGSGWWFLDQKEGMEWQLNALSNLGLLSQFVGMITDSRSFMSYPRHEYFRRVLCNLVGRDVENGELPDDDGLLGPMIRNICYANAERYLGLSEETAGA
jgi:glucuronate isomerase